MILHEYSLSICKHIINGAINYNFDIFWGTDSPTFKISLVLIGISEKFFQILKDKFPLFNCCSY